MKATNLPSKYQHMEIDVLAIAGKAMDPIIAQRLESVAILVLTIGLYINLDSSWWLFGALILLPDISIAAYLVGNRIGQVVYNLLHSYSMPMGIYLLLSSLVTPFILEITLIWIAHIAIDRSLGYGLKFPTNFKHTHLSWK